ncbi:hypothetical protein trd_0294 [Thermomicrobium roseum DSM 5159]|uniref:Uncharacterized protein n=1 Tax=Thermomicrobium roseum (strain ATCC 27502 / DSM 5159 / P-2) TaxID=309801 RepID=B9KXV4_THERP|nr:hypothetical protein trd_0294 [Thermomicrobium roseum DSM 5159]
MNRAHPAWPTRASSFASEITGEARTILPRVSLAWWRFSDRSADAPARGSRRHMPRIDR